MQWPPDYEIEIKRRMLYLDFLQKNPKARAQIMHFYKSHPAEWINDWCVTFDPRSEGLKVMPFVLFQRQRDFIQFLQDCLREQQSGLVEKSRDLGATWLCCAFSVWLWVFHAGSTVGFGSRKAEYVDKPDDPKAIFPKMRQIIANLPRFMVPQGFRKDLHSTHMKLYNPVNGSAITGESGDSIGRGGRTTMYFVDESAHLENPDSVDAALGDNTNVRIDISSVNGTNNSFYRTRMAGEEWTPGCVIPRGKTRVFIFDWRDHPGKTEQWYQERRAQWQAEGKGRLFAQEVDRDYAGAVEGVIIPQAWVKAAIDAHIKLGFEPTGQTRAMQDVADGGEDKNALVIGKGVVCEYADHWAGEAGPAARIAVPLCNERGVTDLYYDCIGVGVGFKTECNTMMKDPSWHERLKLHPWDAGAGPLWPDRPVIPSDPQSPKNKDEYENLKAQAWFNAASRFYKTYMAVTQGQKYPYDELVSISSAIPRLHELCQELSQAVKKDNGVGRTTVDKKPKGGRSPNLADAFVGWLHPCKRQSIFDV